MLWAEQLLERYGVLTREAVLAEGIEGGFSSLYPVLSALEEAGRVRRGYFVEGLGASQFALPEAIERLRKFRDIGERGQSESVGASTGESPVLIAAMDPANPHGATMAWPATDDSRRPARSAGSYAVLIDGRACAWFSPVERRMTLFTEEPELIEAVLCTIRLGLDQDRLRPCVLARLNGIPASEHPLASVFEANGFSAGSRGIVLRRPAVR